ncbi:MAG: cell surface protein SprA [Saprospiraceae bacterium]|nr:cell surface protein SprA [Saprospiraceae bacterium]
MSGAFQQMNAANLPNPFEYAAELAIIVADTIPLQDRKGDFITERSNNPFDLNTSLIEQKVEYDIASGKYIVYEKIGDEYYRTPTYLTFDEYLEWKSKEQERAYFANLGGIQSNKKSGSGKMDPMSRIDISKSLVDRMFGGTEVNVKPQGGIDLTLGFFSYYLTRSNFGQRSPWNYLDPVDIKPRLTVDGNVGTKLKLNFNYDAQSSFNFDQKIKLQYDSQAFSEDDIIKKIEAGNVSLPLKGNLIQGAQSLMGIKTDLQFGHFRMTLLASQQQSKQNNVKVQNGASIVEFDDITSDQYDENRHFFLSHFNRETYERSLSKLPQVLTPFRIAQLEVWISDDRPDYQPGQNYIAAISDIAEGNLDKYNDPNGTLYPPYAILPDYLRDQRSNKPLADNRVNGLFQELVKNDTISSQDKTSTLLKNQFGLRQIRDFEIFRGRMLNPSEYTYHPQLGYISLNIRLRPNQVLGVAYKYFYTEQCDSVFTVGQLTGTSQETSDIRTSSPNQEEEGSPSKVLFVKLLKSSNQQVRLPSWDLMMKNVYNLKTNQLNKDGFQFDVFYEDDFSDGSLKKYIPERPDVPLLNVFKLDTLNKFGDPQADGVFDYVPGLTVIERSGSIIFPVLEPFGSSLDSLLKGLPDPGKYKYQELYDSTVTVARLTPQKNKFVMVGKVKSNATGEIPLGPFVPKNGVKVTAGTITLIEGVDYEIDYALGKLRILNPAYLAQGTPINVNYEDQSAFSSLNKTMLGARFDYDFSKKFTMGATYLRLRERPFTQKVNVGDDPIDNRIFGLDFNYSDKSDWITKVLDKLPFYSTKEESAVNLSAETAYLKPGHNKAINSQADSKDDGGLVNIDDFEGSVSGFTLGGFNTNSWALSSTPPEFREADLTNDLVYGANRAKISWYQIDQSVNTTEADRKHPFSRLVLQTDLFKRQVQTGINQLFTFDVSYYPEERGPYNFDVPEGYPNYTAGTSILDGQIRLNQPTTRWGGLMRYFQNTDFEANNYQFIEFWVLNPFLDKDGRPDPSNEEGEIVFQLGNVSEDVIRDNLQFFENALPTKEEPSVPIKNTNYGKVPLIPPLISNFALENIRQQDLGFDGLTDDEERIKFQSWVDKYGVIQGAVNADPAGDNFTFYNDEKLTGLDMVSRMKDFCGPEGNTPEESNFEDNRFYRGSRTPDSEDLNNDRSLNQGEAYYEYRIKVKNFNGEVDTASSIYYKQYKQVGDNEKWYRFVVPLNKFTSSQNITGFRAIQFMRMYFTNFEKQKTFRFAEFQLVRNQWRISQNQGDCKDGDKPFVSVDEVGVEENTTRLPFNYLVSPGVLQERINSSLGSNLLQDEKSLAINFCNLQRGAPGCDVAVNKLGNLDLNLYKKLQLFVHAESLPDEVYEHGDISIFIKLGKDLTNNYYEYVMPLKTSDFNIQSKENIWPDTNAINIPLSGFLDVKKARLVDGTTLELDDPDNEGAKFVMKGLPSLGYIKVIEIGVRNTSDKTKPLCGQIWVNELRASGLNEKGAFAAQAKAQIKLADLGDINAAGSYSSVGFGSLDQRLLERSRDEIFQYDFSTSLQAGKLLPKFLPISLPFFASYSRSVKKPQYDPYQRDLTVRELLEVTPDEDKQDVRDRAREETKITSYNLTNVKKEGGQGGKPWSLENLSATYAFTKTEKTDPIIKEDVTTERRVGLEYGFSNKPKYIQPLKFIKPKALKLISDFNFNPMPTSLGFNTNMDRYINYRTFRLPESPVFRFDDRRFKWERNYTLDWDFTKSLRLNFKANVTAVVDELRQVGIAPDPADRKWVDAQGRIASADTIDQYRNNSLGRLGRRKNYSHNLGLTYKIPVNLLPMMDWISASADYKSSYTWNAGLLIYIDDRFNLPGNVIQNTQNRSVNATFSFDKLYSKWGYLKKIESGDPRAKTGKSSKKKEEEGGLAKKEEGKDEPKDAADKNKKKDKKKDRYPSTFERILIRPLLALRSVKFSYKEDLGTLIPGFMPEASLLGLSDGFTSPGWQFASGLQPDLDKANPGNFLQKNNAWFNRSEAFNDQITQSERQNFNAKVAIEPFKDFKIDVDFNKDYRNSHTEVFKYKDDSFMQIARFNSGSFEATYASFGTLFDKSEALVAQFKANRAVVSHALKNYNPAEHPDYEGYAYGYGPTNFNVVVPSFLAAYRGVDVNKVPLDLKEDVKSYDYIPRPNWILRYDGLSKLPFFKNFLSSFSLKHGYKSTLSVANFNTQAEYDEAREFKTSENNYFSQIEIPAVTLKEEFSPLIGIDLKTKNNMEIKFEYKKGRTLDLRANSSELSESLNTSVVFGYGYVIDNFKGFGGGRKQRGSRGKRGDGLSGDKGDKDDKDPGGTLGAAGGKDDKSKKKDNKSSASGEKGKKLTINCDFSFKDDVTQNYSLDITEEKEPEKTRGTQTIQISPNVEYQMYKNLALRLYFEYQRTAPKVATNVTTNMSSGIVVRYMFN